MHAQRKRHEILLVDDEVGILSALKRSLIDEPYEILTAASAEEALDLLRRRPCTVVISDERMPGMDGARFLSIVRDLYPTTIRIMLTGHASLDAMMRAVNEGEIYRFFTKPWDDTALMLAIRSAIEKFELEEENRRLITTVRRQSRELKELERRYPGIGEMRRSRDGSYLLPEISDEELEEIIAWCNRDQKNLSG